MQEVGLALWNGVDEVADALGVLSVVLCWVPGANGVLAAGATIAGVAVLARDSVDLATGNGSAADVRGSAVGVAPFGVGRFAQQAIRLSVASAAEAVRCSTAGWRTTRWEAFVRRLPTGPARTVPVMSTRPRLRDQARRACGVPRNCGTTCDPARSRATPGPTCAVVSTSSGRPGSTGRAPAATFSGLSTLLRTP